MLILCHDDSIGTVIGGLEVDCKTTAAGCFELASVVLVLQVKWYILLLRSWLSRRRIVNLNSSDGLCSLSPASYSVFVGI